MIKRIHTVVTLSAVFYINVCCRFICIFMWLCGGGGVPSYWLSKTLSWPQ